jgi:1-acyl-sn-glycerol-3-phosphate acyltransferase
MVVTVVVFVEVALVGKMVWFVLTPLSSKWLGTGFTLLELTSVLSRLLALALALGFELQVDGSENIWLLSGVVLRLHIPVVTCRCITFGDGGQG